MPVKNNRILMLLVFALLGFVIALQFRSNLKMTNQKTSAVYKMEELMRQLEEEKKYGELLKSEISKNEAKKDNYLKSSIENKNDSILIERLRTFENIRLKAGLTDVKGSGVIVKLDDAAMRTNENPNYLIIHDSDIISVMNELKKAGAQAISINDERIIATSEQVCAGPTVRINKKRYAAPFVIRAIGNPENMYDGVSKSEAVSLMLRDKIRVSIEKSQEIVIPKFSDNLNNLMTGLEVIN